MGHYRNYLLGRQFASLITRNVCFLAFHLAVNKLPYILKHNIFSFGHTHTHTQAHTVKSQPDMALTGALLK